MEKEWQDCYKVVQKYGNRFVSFCFDTDGGVLVGTIKKFKVYAIGHTTKRTRGDGPMAVYASEAEARRLIDSDGYWVNQVTLLRCRYKESADSELWQYYRGDRRSPKYYSEGTKYADVVEALEAVKL